MISKTDAREAVSASYPPGIHVPSLTWFKDNARQDIDWETQKKHIEFVINGGVHGSKHDLSLTVPLYQLTVHPVVIAGTNGEAATLGRTEKAELVQSTRAIASQLSTSEFPITVGCVGGCTREVIDDTVAMHEAGANFALVLIPSYFHFAMTQDAIVGFFQEVADASPLPIVIYNFPAVVAGLDVNSEMLEILGAHPNIVAVKLTCGGIAKVARVAATFAPTEFCALAGQSDCRD